MPTGEHRLFDAMPSVLSAPSPTGSNPDDDFLMNKGKFGAPSNPATRTAWIPEHSLISDNWTVTFPHFPPISSPAHP